MKCTRCNILIEPETQSLICPHFTLDSLPAPTGGFRFPAEARDGIEIALLKRDREALLNYASHNNPLVRTYAQRMLEVFKADLSGDGRDFRDAGDGL